MKEKKIENLSVRFAAEDMVTVRKEAANAGMSVSKYVRDKALAHSVPAKEPRINSDGISALRQAGQIIYQIYKGEITDKKKITHILTEAIELIEGIRMK